MRVKTAAGRQQGGRSSPPGGADDPVVAGPGHCSFARFVSSWSCRTPSTTFAADLTTACCAVACRRLCFSSMPSPSSIMSAFWRNVRTITTCFVPCTYTSACQHMCTPAANRHRRDVRADGWGFSQMGGGDGVGPGPNALKSQVIGFLFAAAYMRGAERLPPAPLDITTQLACVPIP